MSLDALRATWGPTMFPGIRGIPGGQGPSQRGDGSCNGGTQAAWQGLSRHRYPGPGVCPGWGGWGEDVWWLIRGQGGALMSIVPGAGAPIPFAASLTTQDFSCSMWKSWTSGSNYCLCFSLSITVSSSSKCPSLVSSFSICASIRKVTRDLISLFPDSQVLGFGCS